MGESKIEWTNATWNPVRGCSLVSAGCTNCYAMKSAHRMSSGAYKGLTRLGPNGPVWTGDVRFVPEILDYPLRLKKPHMIFVNSMSDLFHESLTEIEIGEVFSVMARCPQHIFQILTKRPQSMLEVLCTARDVFDFDEPLPNVWLGVSVEDQKTADERIPLLLETPAAVRWVSAEPLLGPIDLANLKDGTFNALDGIDFENIGDIRDAGILAKSDRPGLDWLVVGGESGAGARPCHLDWIESLVSQCQATATPVFVKQLGRVPVMDEAKWRDTSPVRLLSANGRKVAPAGTVALAMSDSKGHNLVDFPSWLRVRQWPEVQGRASA